MHAHPPGEEHDARGPSRLPASQMELGLVYGGLEPVYLVDERAL